MLLDNYLNYDASKKRWHHDFLKNNSVKNKLILVIFGAQNPEETSHQTIIDVSTSYVKCRHCTLWKRELLLDFVRTSKLKADILNTT